MEDFENIEFSSLSKDEYYLFCEMMILSLKTDNVIEGLNKSLYLLKKCLKSGDISLYMKNLDNIYVFGVGDIEMTNNNNNRTASFVNYSSRLTEMCGRYLINTVDGHNMLFLHVKTDNHEYILSIKDVDLSDKREKDFFVKLVDVLQIVLKRAESYHNNVRAISTDLLTGLDNRNSYENRKNSLDENQANLVYGLFDLFRLKYINDNYGHVYGDIYIQKTAEILAKYWPKLIRYTVDFNEVSSPTGYCVYRIGGDEFALLTDNEPIDITISKAEMAAEEVKLIDLGLGEDVQLGLNYGIVEHVPGSKFKETVNAADAIISEDKKNMYLRLGLDRRK